MRQGREESTAHPHPSQELTKLVYVASNSQLPYVKAVSKAIILSHFWNFWPGLMGQEEVRE